MEVSGTHIVVTGAANRLGRRILEDLIRHYQSLKITAHFHKKRGDGFDLSAISSKKHQVYELGADLSQESAARSLIHLAAEKYGPVEILIHGASVFQKKDFLNIASVDIDLAFSLHLKSALWMAQEVAKNLKGKKGSFIFLLDVFSVKPLSSYISYSVSKAALGMLTKSLAKELAPLIRVNSLSPGTILPEEGMAEEAKKKAIQKNLFSYWGGGDSLCGGIRFLLENEYVTGVNLVIDGGRSIVP